MFRAEGVNLQFNRHKAGQCTVIEQQINEVFQMRDNLMPQILFLVRFLKVEKFNT